MKKKKSLIAIIALFLVVLIGATFAYFQSSASFANVFNTGTYKVVTTEVFESPSNWAPGEEIPKTITTTNEGTIDAAVRVSYTEKWEDEDGNDITSSVASGTAIINLDNTSEWTLENGYYYYNYILKPGDTTSSFMKSVTLNPELNDVTCTPSQDGLTKTCESTNPAVGAKYTLTITKETVQYDKYSTLWSTNVNVVEYLNPISYITRQNDGQITTGDVIRLGDTEEFYVVSSNAQKTVLLAKYNLKVGNIYNSVGTKTSEYTNADTGYGLQSSEARGYVSGDTRYGTVAFDSEYPTTSYGYWMDNTTTLNSNYSESGVIYYDSSNFGFKHTSDNTRAFPYVYDDNATIKTYVDNYVSYLTDYGVSNITGRLLRAEEAKTLGCDDSSYSCTSSTNTWVYDTSYLLGSAVNSIDVWYVASDGCFSNSDFGNDSLFGVRPVIEIDTSELN